MKITLNNTPIIVENNCTLMQLIEQEKLPINNIALAVNNCIVLRNEWATTTLNEGDKIVAIVAAYGG